MYYVGKECYVYTFYWRCSLTLNEIRDILSQGTVFLIQTEKTVELAAGAPCRFMSKISSYSVTTKIGPDPDPSWWSFTDIKNIVKKNGTKRHYLLCKMASVVFGSSEFHPINDETGEIDEDTSYSKRDILRYLPPAQPFEKGTVLTLPIDSILSLKLYTPTPKIQHGVVNLSDMLNEPLPTLKLRQEGEPYAIPEGVPNGY
jgi:hypothetical protein